MADILEGTVG